MSILKFVNHNNRTLEELETYLTNPDKTAPDLIIGFGVDPYNFVEQASFAASLYECNISLLSYWHIILSFNSDVLEKVSIDSVKEIVTRVGHLFCSNHQVLAVIHTDKPNIHAHYCINAVGIDGKQFRQGQSLYTYKQIVNQILQQYGLSPIYCYSGQPA
ncbi:relaxase/mobilization nuclease domain-containing protein [Sporomusa sp.]|uniref:relaxase/mobilization nuclease domain-containing protein n=1 Tax=Sporomusa sp. TaxID=2078658 RepID=UPI002CFFA076|nr:relaxase/mobilization nuclease domain-containing protein [Sporomusa sp.]HWR42270.1 relaxase/mobilization nuclease domain-containing protein [Sporomusa sp.]